MSFHFHPRVVQNAELRHVLVLAVGHERMSHHAMGARIHAVLDQHLAAP